MNFYICSTVRHLLFALLQALSEPDQTHHILFFSDFQSTSLEPWDLAHLPANINVHEGNRRQFRKELTSDLRGTLFYFLAMRNLAAPGFLRQAFFKTLGQLHPDIATTFRNAEDRELWLFNERNKMARVFRLITQRFNLIEEGSGNYHYFTKSVWRWPGRALLGRPYNKLSFGEDRRCQTILVSYPEKLPPFVARKGARIDFLDTPASKQVIRRMFGDTDFSMFSDAVIVATSPLDTLDNISVRQKLSLYQLMVETLSGMGLNAILKLHPRENTQDYAALRETLPFAPEKLPLEVVIVLSEKPVTILSFFTSAGIGLEPYFRLVELCGRTDSAGYEIHKLYEWLAHPELLRELIQSRLNCQSAIS